MAREEDLKKVINLLSVWIVRIRNNNAISLFDINKIAESFCLKLLNLIYGFNLEDLNKEKSNFPGLDLGDRGPSKVAFQITSRTDTNKVFKTLRIVKQKKYEESFTGGIRFLILSDGSKIKFPKIKPDAILSTFNSQRDIIYIDDIIKQIKAIFDSDDILFLKIKKIVESDLAVDLFPEQKLPSEWFSVMDAMDKKIDQLRKEHSVNFKLDENSFFVTDLQLPEIPILSLRKLVLADIDDKLQSRHHIWISGNVSTGKTQLALLLGQRNPHSTYWYEAGRLKLNKPIVGSIIRDISLATGLNAVATIKNTLTEIFSIWDKNSLLILNDLPIISGKEEEKRDLALLLKEAAASNVEVIITSNHSSIYKNGDEVACTLLDYPIPMFSKEETGEVMRVYGASELLIEEAADLICVLTEGHPLLINAVSKYLQSSSWKIDNDFIKAVFQGNVGEDYKSELYNRIIDSSSDEKSKNLLYRIRIIAGSFSGEEIDIVSKVKPIIENRHEVLQNLKGVWLRIIDNQKYELSPLIKNMSSNLAPDLELSINNALGDFILSKGLISQLEAHTVINYFQKGNSFAKLSMVLILVLQESISNKELFYRWGFDKYWYYEKFPDDISPLFKVLIRFLQVSIAVRQEKDVEFLLDDLSEIVDNEDAGVLGQILKNLIFHQVFAKTNPLTALSNFIEAKNKLSALNSHLPNFPVSEMMQDDFIWLSFYKINTRADFESWFKGFENIDGEFTGNDLRGSQGYIVAGHSLVRLCVIPRENVPESTETLLAIINLCLKNNLSLLAVYALRYVIRLNGLNEVDPAQSHAVLDRHRTLINSVDIFQYLIYEELGRQMYYASNPEGSVDSISSVAGIELPSYYIYDLDIFWIFPKLLDDKNINGSHLFFMRGFERVMSDERSLLLDKIKFHGEAGISFWLSGSNREALSHLEKGYELLLDNFDDSDEHKAAVIRYGSISNYIKELVIKGIAPTTTGDGGTYAIPVRGNFYQPIDGLIELYFDERKFVSSIVFEDAFEFYDDRDIAKKWAYLGIEISMKLNSSRFAGILFKDLLYLIGDGEYEKVCNLYLYLEDYLKKLTESSEAKDDPELRSALGNGLGYKKNEPYFFQFILLPSIFVIGSDVLQKIDEIALQQKLEDLFSSFDSVIEDKETFYFFKQLYQKILVDKISLTEIDKLVEVYSGEYHSQIYTTAYVLASLHVNSLEAARMHCALMPGLDEIFGKHFSAFYRFHLVPFFTLFWRGRFRTNKDDFFHPERLESVSIPYFMNAPIGDKLKFIFQALSHHLNIDPDPAAVRWLNR